jgi:hypothetical protein
MNDELKAAAGRTREHQFACSRNAMDEGPYNEDAGLQQQDESALIDWAIARLDADETARSEREKPIDEEWLRSIGFYPTTDRGDLFHHNDIAGAFIIHSLGVISWGCEVYDIGEFTIRGQLLDLLRVLGIQVKP